MSNGEDISISLNILIKYGEDEPSVTVEKIEGINEPYNFEN